MERLSGAMLGLCWAMVQTGSDTLQTGADMDQTSVQTVCRERVAKRGETAAACPAHMAEHIRMAPEGLPFMEAFN
jgi:hypothetical protein